MQRRFVGPEDKEVVIVRKREKEIKRRAPRTHRTFQYRGISFFVKTEQGISSIYTGQGEGIVFQASVKSDVLMKAVMELAKISIAEARLASLVTKQPKGDH